MNHYSQNGEDEIIESLLTKLELSQGLFCEFGAWDGEHLSNCRFLLDTGWKGIFIEGDPKRYALLKNKFQHRPDVITVNKFIGLDSENNLDQILQSFDLIKSGKELDLLSIDIDGDDLNIWKSLKSTKPIIVIIEYNNTIPNDVEFIQPPGTHYGNSALAIDKFAKQNGYAFVSATETNLFYVRRDKIKDKFYDLPSINELNLFANQQRFWFSYDGGFMTNQIELNTKSFIVPWTTFISGQPIPSFLRGLGKWKLLRFTYSILKLLFFRPFIFRSVLINVLQLIRLYKLK
jgi:hypothetical protein